MGRSCDTAHAAGLASARCARGGEGAGRAVAHLGEHVNRADAHRLPGPHVDLVAAAAGHGA